MSGTQSTPIQSKPHPLLKITNKLYDVLAEIDDEISSEIIEIESLATLFNGLRIEEVDLSDSDYCFAVKIEGRAVHSMKISRFIRYFFKDQFDQKKIYLFSKKYNRLKKSMFNYWTPDSEEESFKKLDLINPDLFKTRQDPKDPKATFISLVTETYPYGDEEGVMKFMPEGLTKDEFGNYYRIIGESKTMFTSHLDTADRNKSKTKLYELEKSDGNFIVTNGSTILGADDKSGVTIMLYMMAHNIPGIYYFFIGEERGCIGSRKVSENLEKISHLRDVKRCISFDRRNYHSIITMQMGGQCCSDTFGNALAKEMNKSGMDMSLDPTGIYTDSACFMEQIPECTNVSVGYFDEHTSNESQNMDFLDKICKASIKVDWESLPTARKVGLDDRLKEKFNPLILDFRRLIFYSEVKMVGDGDVVSIRIKYEDNTIDEMLKDLMNMSSLMTKHKVDPDVYVTDELIKIEFR